MLTLGQALVLAVLAGTVALFIWNPIRYDLVALPALLAAMASATKSWPSSPPRAC